jgi:hypothetical protein
MATVKPTGNVVKSLKKAGFYGASKPKRLGIINKVCEKNVLNLIKGYRISYESTSRKTIEFKQRSFSFRKIIIL